MENNVNIYDLCYYDEVYLNCDCSECPHYAICGNPNEKYIDEED